MDNDRRNSTVYISDSLIREAKEKNISMSQVLSAALRREFEKPVPDTEAAERCLEEASHSIDPKHATNMLLQSIAHSLIAIAKR